MRTPASRWHACFAAALATLAAAAPRAVEPQGAGGAPAYVEFRVVSENGEPVPDLKPSDVTLRVGGRPRTLASLQLVRVGQAGGSTAPGLPPPFSTNAAVSPDAGTRRDVLIVVDELSISPGKEPPIREALQQMLSALTPADRVGVISTRQGGPALSFTSAAQEASAALTKFAGYAPGQLAESDFACNAMLVLNTLRSAFGQFAPDAAPTLVFVSAAVAGPRSDKMATVGRESELCPLRTNHFDEVGAVALESRASTYVVHALSAGSAGQAPQEAQAGIDAIAGSTGAETIRISGGATDTSLVRVARETSAYYLASFDPEAADRTGNRHRVEVRVAREHVRVSARPNIVIAKAAAPTKPVTPRDMIRVPTKFTDLPLRAAWHARRNPDGKTRIDALFEPIEGGTKLNAAIAITYDEKGRSKAQWIAQDADLGRSPVLASLLVDPGKYRLRVAATDAAGRAGTVDWDVDADLLQAGGIRLSGLVLGVVSGGAFAPRLAFGPGDDQAIGLLEIYGAAPDAPIAVTLELAETENGPAIASGSTQINPAAGGTRIAIGGFSIAGMQPGDLQMRAVVALDGKRIGSVVRTVRKFK